MFNFLILHFFTILHPFKNVVNKITLICVPRFKFVSRWAGKLMFETSKNLVKIAKITQSISEWFFVTRKTELSIRKTSAFFPHFCPIRFALWQRIPLKLRFWTGFLPVLFAFLPKVLSSYSFQSSPCAPIRGLGISQWAKNNKFFQRITNQQGPYK